MRRLRALFLAAALALGLLTPARAEDAAEPLLRGARYFKTKEYGRALVEFRVAERLLGRGSEATWYAAASLLKLDRFEEAVEAFAAARSRSPEQRDHLLDYYDAIACYEARLYLAADERLTSVKGVGPEIAALVSSIRRDIAELLLKEPATGSVDYYLARGQALLAAKRPELARVYASEAIGLTSRRKAPHRLSEAKELLDAAERAIHASEGRR